MKSAIQKYGVRFALWCTSLRRRRAFFGTIAVLVFGILFLASSQGVSAEVIPSTDSLLTGVGNGIIHGLSWIFFGLASLGLKLTMWALQMILALAEYNGYIDSPAVVVGWFVVRDVANMFFIVALLVIAFGTILGLEQYEWKKSLGKLIVAAILINFSRLLLGWMIDVTHVFMVAFLNAVQGAAGGNLIHMFNLDNVLAMSGQGSTSIAHSAESSPVSAGYANKENLRVDILIAAFSAFMFSVVAFVSVLAYTIVLVVRVVMLWILIVMSPLAFVLQSIPQGKSYAQEFWSEFTKYLLVGPVAVFFLWLAFASLGSGDVSRHVGISGASAQDAREAAAIGNANANQSVSLSLATRWDNLSTFVIAVAFLFVGLERVQKLGVKGGGMVSGATSFGGKVATIASGYAAGRWLTNRGAGKLKEGGIGLAKFGGGALYRGSGAKELVTRAGSKLSAGWAKNKEARAQWAKGVEKDSKGKGFKGFMARRLASFVEPADRKEKRIRDWKRGAELAQKRLEENLGTSSTAAGQFKQREGRRLNSMEQLAQSKKIQKEASMEEKAFKVFLDVDENTNKHRDALTAAGVTGKDLDKQTEKYRKGLVNGLSGDDKLMYTLGKELQGDRVATVGGMAGGEQSREALDDAKKLAIARARDDILTGRGENAQFESLALSEIQERKQKRIDALNFREATEAGIQYGGRFKAKRAAMGLVGGVAGMTEEQRRDLSDSGSLAASALISNLKKGSENGMVVYNKAASDAGFTDPVDADNITGQQAKLMSVLLQRKVEEADVGAAFDEFQQIHGEQGANTILRQLEAGLNTSAADGAVNLSGLLYNKDVDPSTGKINYKLADQSNAGHRAFTQDTRKYLAEEVSKNLKSITGVGDLIDESKLNGLGQLANTLSPEAIEQFVDAFGNVQANTQLNKRLVNDMQKKFVHDTGPDAGKIRAEARDLFEKMNRDNAEALLKKIASADDMSTW